MEASRPPIGLCQPRSHIAPYLNPQPTKFIRSDKSVPTSRSKSAKSVEANEKSGSYLQLPLFRTRTLGTGAGPIRVQSKKQRNEANQSVNRISFFYGPNKSGFL